MMTDLERRQRLEWIETRLLELARNRALADTEKAGLDASYDRATIDMEVRRLREERQQLLAEPSPQPGDLRLQIRDMWVTVLRLDADWREWRASDAARATLIDRWLVTLTILLAVAYGILVALGVQTWHGG